MKEPLTVRAHEAYAILLYKNYIDKWVIRYHNPPPPDVKESKIMGKYTRSSIGYSEYGGWSEEGVIRFNELCSIVVVEDRSSCNVMDSEEWVMLRSMENRHRMVQGIQTMRTGFMIQKLAWKGMHK